MRTSIPIAFAAVLALSPAAVAQIWHVPTPQERTQMMRKIHTGFVLELGELLGLDTDGTLRLAGRLQPFDDQRIQLRIENATAMRKLRQAAKGNKPLANAAELASKVADNRVKLAQINKAELEEILKGLPPEKIAQVVVFTEEYTRRVEQMARQIHHEMWMRHHGGWQDSDHSGG